MPDITEGKARIRIPSCDKLSRKMPVFFNPKMKHNRDLSVLLISSVPDSAIKVLLPMAGSGIRGLRFLAELSEGKIAELHMNDTNPEAIKAIEVNIRSNKPEAKKTPEVFITNRDANALMRETRGFDYIDIDPFGTPNHFLDSSVQALSRDGIIAVTATDTSALCGTYRNACIRKYWAIPSHNQMMHEVGLRILIRKVQLIAAQYGIALSPIFSYSKDHYMRVFFRKKKGKEQVDELLKMHGYIEDTSIKEPVGPMWLGKLYDKAIAKKMLELSRNMGDKSLVKFLNSIALELDIIGFIDIHKICKHKGLTAPKTTDLLNSLESKGYKASTTHFSYKAIKCDIEEEKLLEIIRDISKI